MRVTLNLATRQASGAGARGRLAVAAGVLVLGLTVWVGGQGVRVWQEGAGQARAGELRARAEQLTRTQKEYEARLRAPAARAVIERATFYNHLLERRALSWSQLFVALERHLPDRVRILELRPAPDEAGKLRLELRVGAESARALVEFLRTLEQGAGFANVAVRSRRTGEGSGEDAIIAEVSLTYQGGE